MTASPRQTARRLLACYGRGRHFWYDFAPFIFVLAIYDFCTGLIHYVNPAVHYQPMLAFDRWLGGGVIPSIRLQHWLYGPALHWYDYYFFVFYILHILLPVALAWLIWRYKIEYFRRYIGCFLLISLGGFIVYTLYPAAPPWMAAEHGKLAGLHQILPAAWNSFGYHLARYFRSATPDQVAAIPSLHAAFPTFFWLYVRRIWGWRWALLAIVYPLSIWFGVVYMGEHYVLDVLLGIALAAAAYLGTTHTPDRTSGQT